MTVILRVKCIDFKCIDFLSVLKLFFTLGQEGCI